MRKPPGPKGTPAKKVKKRNPWSDEDSKSDSDVENSKPIIPREKQSQRASGKLHSDICSTNMWTLYGRYL